VYILIKVLVVSLVLVVSSFGAQANSWVCGDRMDITTFTFDIYTRHAHLNPKLMGVITSSGVISRFLMEDGRADKYLPIDSIYEYKTDTNWVRMLVYKGCVKAWYEWHRQTPLEDRP